MKYFKSISWFLGVSMFMFGILKFVDPFKGWYEVQISQSGLGGLAYSMGILGEISIGAALVLSMVFWRKFSGKTLSTIVSLASLAIIIMMVTAIYVHLQPGVPAEVLPMKIKPPVVPAVFLLLALANIVFSWKYKRQ